MGSHLYVLVRTGVCSPVTGTVSSTIHGAISLLCSILNVTYHRKVIRAEFAVLADFAVFSLFVHNEILSVFAENVELLLLL